MEDQFVRGWWLTVDVRGTAGVVAREDGLELHDALLVAGLDTAQEGRVEVAGVGGVAVAAGLDTGVDTLVQVLATHSQIRKVS